VLRNYRKQNMQTTARTLILDSVGIDVGFFQTKFTLGRSTSNSSVGSSILVGQFPSIAPTAFSGGQLTAAKNLDGVHVTINKQTYFVGASAPVLMGSAGYLRSASERYCATNDYAALLKGALWHISRHHKATRSLVIKNLVVGLPMTTIYDNSAFLEELCSGDHVLPSPVDTNEEIKISVKSVVVVAQPQGAIVNYKMTSPVGSVKDNDKVLVIDMGGGTFDWFVSLGDFTPVYKLCSATNVGTLNVASLVAGKIKSTFKSNHFILEDIDLALRTGADTFAIGNKNYAMTDYWPEVSGLVGGALSQMRNVVGEVEHIKHVVLSGGGAPLLQRVMREQMPDLAEQIKVDADPVYGNVRGFHHISEMIGD
jgi:plasmid segregation protein ParM